MDNGHEGVGEVHGIISVCKVVMQASRFNQGEQSCILSGVLSYHGGFLHPTLGPQIMDKRIGFSDRPCHHVHDHLSYMIVREGRVKGTEQVFYMLLKVQ